MVDRKTIAMALLGTSMAIGILSAYLMGREDERLKLLGQLLAPVVPSWFVIAIKLLVQEQ